MRVNDITKVKPAKDFIVVQNIELDKNNELYFAKSSKPDPKNAELSFGKVLAIGPTALNLDSCPELKCEDTIVYNRYSGSHIATKQLNEIFKVMIGYNVMARIDDINNLNEETIYPSANRLLLAVKYVDQDETGIFLDANEAKDPRLEDIDYGTVIKIGPSCKLGYQIGDIVAYNPYSGENIRPPGTADRPALRVLIEEDVLLTI